MKCFVSALSRDHLAYGLMNKMIHQTPERRPNIVEVSGQLKISQFGSYRTLTHPLRMFEQIVICRLLEAALL
jgi:hypothetical protein